MAHSFIAYIDESGDDGLPGRYREPGVQGGASHWLTIGAVVWRYSRDLDADIAVSGLTWALEPDTYGNCEPRFATALKPRVYNRQGNYMSYGTKMVPACDKIQLTEQQKPFLDLFGK